MQQQPRVRAWLAGAGTTPAGTTGHASAGADRTSAEADGIPAGTPGPSYPVWMDLVVVVATCTVLSFGGIGLLLADTGHYSASLVFPASLAGTAAASVLARPTTQERARPRRRSWSLAALGACAVALGQLAWNAADVTRHVVGDRDPGTYLIIGKWLAAHRSLIVPATNLWWGKGIFFSMTSAGVYPMGDGTLQFQFAHMMSVLLAEADNLGGDRLMFRPRRCWERSGCAPSTPSAAGWPAGHGWCWQPWPASPSASPSST